MRQIRKIIRKFGYDIVRYSGTPQSVLDIEILFVLFFYKNFDNFYFVQVGANDGVRSDHLYKSVVAHNLAGLLIEPQSDVFVELKKNYSECDNVAFANVAVSDTDGTKSFYQIHPDKLEEYNKCIVNDASGLSSFLKPQLEEHVRKHLVNLPKGAKLDDYIQEIKVPTARFDSLFESNNINRVDLLQIDVEGYDYEIIKLFDFSKYEPIMVVYENRHLSQSDTTECELFLERKGYIVTNYGSNTCAFRASLLE